MNSPNGSQIDVFLLGTILLCCIMSVLNLFKNRKRGWPGLLLSAGFLVFAVIAYLWRSGASTAALDACSAFLLLLIGTDFIIRTGGPAAGKKR